MVQAIHGTVARGLLADYPSDHSKMLVKIVEQLLPRYCVIRLLEGRCCTVEILRRVFGIGDVPLVITDPVLSGPVDG
jgi:hypothetical protein